MNPLEGLVARWREDADVLERHGRADQAERLRRQAEQVEDALRRRRTELLTVAEAADFSGYSEKHLRRLVRDGKLEAEQPGGKGGRILLSRGALPRKARDGDRDGSDGDPVAGHLERVGGCS